MTMSPAFPIAVGVMTSRRRGPGIMAGMLAEFRAASARRRMRRTYQGLLSGDDHTLVDIGLSRDTIRQALAGR